MNCTSAFLKACSCITTCLCIHLRFTSLYTTSVNCTGRIRGGLRHHFGVRHNAVQHQPYETILDPSSPKLDQHNGTDTSDLSARLTTATNECRMLIGNFFCVLRSKGLLVWTKSENVERSATCRKLEAMSIPNFGWGPPTTPNLASPHLSSWIHISLAAVGGGHLGPLQNHAKLPVQNCIGSLELNT